MRIKEEIWVMFTNKNGASLWDRVKRKVRQISWDNGSNNKIGRFQLTLDCQRHL